MNVFIIYLWIQIEYQPINGKKITTSYTFV